MRMSISFVVAVVVGVVAGCAGAPSGFEPAGVDAPAYRRGVNVNHWLSGNYGASHTYGAPWFDAEDVAWIAAHGFDHIRIRVTSVDWLRPDGTLDPAKVAPLDAALGWARAHQLGVVIAMTAFPGRPVDRSAAADFADPGLHAAAVQLWALVAARYPTTAGGSSTSRRTRWRRRRSARPRGPMTRAPGSRSSSGTRSASRSSTSRPIRRASSPARARARTSPRSIARSRRSPRGRRAPA